MAQYATVVFPNGRIVKFRQRDQGNNRFKATLIHPQGRFGDELMTDFISQNGDVDYDDCDGDGLATFLRFVMESTPVT
jgi:hypothetical protein